MSRRSSFFCVLAVLLLIGCDAKAKSFSLDRVRAEIHVEKNGSVRVTESITYRFDGRFSYGYRSIPVRPGDRVYDVDVSEEDNAYARSTSKIPGSYTVEQRPRDVVVTWYFRANDEVREFLVSYTVEGSVTRHPDVADFNHVVFSNETGRGVGEVSAAVTLPGGMQRSDLLVFAHGPLNGRVEIASDSTVRASVAPLPTGEFFDVRVLMPSAAFDAMPVEGEVAGDAIVEEERRWAKEADRRREVWAAHERDVGAERERRAQGARALFPVAVILCAVALGTWFAFFRRYGWPHSVTAHAPPGEIPSDHPPAIVAFLLARGVGGPALVATLVDLAERGVFKIHETRREKRGWRGDVNHVQDFRFDRVARSPVALAPFERELVEFMVDDVGDGGGFSMSDLKAYAKKHRREVRAWFAGWVRTVKEAASAEEFFEPYPAAAMVTNALLGAAIVVGGALVCASTSSPAGVPAIVGGFLQALLTVTLNRRTERGRRLMIEWKRFRTHLKSLASKTAPVSLASRDWSLFIAAAILFGMHKKLVPCLSIADGRAGGVCPAWYSAMASHSGGEGVGALADGFSSMITSVASTVSSSTGAGGGASVGGGGGAGGGSAGAG